MGAKFCQECGTKLAEGAKFCPECGTKINQGETKPEPLFDFSDDTAKYGDAEFGGFDAQLKKKQKSEGETGSIPVQLTPAELAELSEAQALCVDEAYDIAIPILKKYAEKGNAQAQLRLADCYCLGEGVPEDKEKYFYWLQKSAEQGYADAQCNFGMFYDGEDNEKAIYWYQKAAEQGDLYAKSRLETLLKKR